MYSLRSYEYFTLVVILRSAAFYLLTTDAVVAEVSSYSLSIRLRI